MYLLKKTSAWRSGIELSDGYGNTFSDITQLRLSDPQYIVKDQTGVALVYANVNYAQDIILDTILPIGIYGDNANTLSIDNAWTLRNCTGSADGSAYTVTFDNSGDGLLRSFTDTGQDFDIFADLEGTGTGNMIGLCALDSSGDGIAFSDYNTPQQSFIWVMANYGYSSTGSTNNVTINQPDGWYHLKRRGTSWYGRRLLAGATWATWSPAQVDGRTITQIGIIRAYSTNPPIPVKVKKFIYCTPTPGYGISS